MVIVVFIVRILDEKKLFDNMHYVFLLFPTYAYVFILSVHIDLHSHNKIFQSIRKRPKGNKSEVSQR